MSASDHPAYLCHELTFEAPEVNDPETPVGDLPPIRGYVGRFTEMLR